jgi:hypothetical protein
MKPVHYNGAMAITTDPVVFWKDYEARIGQKILRYSLGRYLSGWDEFREELWGLAIIAEGGFRFHHFPHENWLSFMSRSGSGREAPVEKLFQIARESFTGVELVVERSWLKRLLSPSQPVIRLSYRKVDGGDGVVMLEVDKEPEAFAADLRSLFADP